VNDKLIQLAEQSTIDVEKYQRKFYWEADGYKFNNINLVRWYEQENNCWAEFKDRQFPLIQKILEDKTIDPGKNYNLEFIKRLKDRYTEVNLLFSGGYESTLIFYYFVKNNISIDETITNIGLDIEPEITDEIMCNVRPLLAKYDKLVNKKTIVQYSYDDIEKRWQDEYAFFNKPFSEVMPPPVSNIGLGNVIPTNTQACYIKGTDRPQMIFYNNSWYVFSVDSQLATHFEMSTIVYFWLDALNIKSLIKDARSYRDHLVNSGSVTTEALQFFYLAELDRLNFMLGRPEIPAPDIKLTNTKKAEIRKTRLIEKEKYSTMFYYCRCMKKFHEIFPYTASQNFDSYNEKGKFAWFINIDTLQAYTQQQLIPNGFIKDQLTEK